MPLSSLTQWSQEHIGKLFESRSDSDAILAIDQTFATSLRGTLNGKDLTFDDVKPLVQAVRNGSPTRSLKVEWYSVMEVPADEQGRGGTFEGTYVIRGISKVLPGYDLPVQFTRHKTVTVRIESDYDVIDSRRIVELTLTANDRMVNQLAKK